MVSIGCSSENSRPAAPAPPPATSASSPEASQHATPGTAPTSDAVVSVDSEETVVLRTVAGTASRVGDELRIRLLDGRTAVFKDDTTAGLKFALPRYAGYFKTIRSHVIHIEQYEGAGAYLVVDDSTGDSTIVFGMPVPSPDGKRFALTQMAGEAGYNAGLIEVWRMVGRKPENEFSFDTEYEPWEASDAVWRDSVTLDFIENSHSSPGAPYMEKPARLIRKGATWVVQDELRLTSRAGPRVETYWSATEPSIVVTRREYIVYLTASMSQILKDSLPEFALAQRQNYDSAFVAGIDAHAPQTAALSAVLGDFNGDGKVDLAMMGKANNAAGALVFLTSGERPRLFIVERFEALGPGKQGEYLSLVKPQVFKLHRGSVPSTIDLSTDAIERTFIDKMTELIYLDYGVVKRVQTSEPD